VNCQGTVTPHRSLRLLAPSAKRTVPCFRPRSRVTRSQFGPAELGSSEGLEAQPSDPWLAARRSMKVAGVGQKVISGRWRSDVSRRGCCTCYRTSDSSGFGNLITQQRELDAAVPTDQAAAPGARWDLDGSHSVASQRGGTQATARVDPSADSRRPASRCIDY
jgi:hypothetical protein